MTPNSIAGFRIRTAQSLLVGLLTLTAMNSVGPFGVAAARPGRKTKDYAQNISLSLLAGNVEPLQAADPSLPDQVISQSRGRVLKGAYQICILTNGSVQSVTPVLSIAGADEQIMDTLKSWSFPRLPFRICKVQTLTFEIP